MGSKNISDNSFLSPELLTALLRSYKNGDENAFDRLVQYYMPLIDSMVTRCYEGLSPYYERDDVLQFALIALSRAALTYKLEQNKVTFGLYAKICIGNALISKMRSARKSHVEVFPIEGIFNMADPEDISKSIVEKETLNELSELISLTLSGFENEVFGLYASGFSSSDIARKLNKTEKSVENAIFRARKKLKSVLNETPM
ncbi:MAG: sigma-70 family RNA polymerase sigma factor [Clostridia bacterium]|nr:sigma-70 family RNA polymerase sigma factor [Clostridia bacterium]